MTPLILKIINNIKKNSNTIINQYHQKLKNFVQRKIILWILIIHQSSFFSIYLENQKVDLVHDHELFTIF